MPKDDVLEEILEIAQDRWNAVADELSPAFRVSLRAWQRVIVGLQRVRLAAILTGLEVPPRLTIFLAGRWPVRLLPALDLDKWPVDSKTLPGCSRRG